MASAAVESSSAVEDAAMEAAKTGLAAGRVSSGDPPTREPAEGAGMYSGRSTSNPGLTKRLVPGGTSVRIRAAIEVHST